MDNGLRLVLVPAKENVAAAVLILVEAGSEYETFEQNGISHFLEHLVFKGTARRPRPGMVAAELDALGAEYNAFTAQEYTGYWAKAQSHKLGEVLDLLSDLYLHPIFDAAEIEKERGVIIEEINMYEDLPMRRVEQIFVSLLYGNQPAGWDIAGRKEIIRRLKREDILTYRQKHYLPQATTVVIAGNFSEKWAIKEVRRIFGTLARGKKAARFVTQEKQGRPQVMIKFKKSDQSHIVLGTRAWNIFDPRRYVLQVLAEILGGGMSSRLFIRVREEMGAAYYIRAGADLFLDHGYFSVSAGIDHSKLALAIGAILDELRRIKEKAVEARELKKAKDHLIGGLMLNLETADELASFYGSQEILTRRLIPPAEIVKRLNRVTAAEVKAAARAIFKDRILNLAIIGPYRRPERFRRLLRLE
ncbi:MAG: insulinase family protein [candidate division KSB1 bacterium]|nr:insulinase family protein [candidate division KSB1 bacterium]